MKKSLALVLTLMLCVLSVASALAAPAQELVFALNNEPDGIDPGITNNSFASPFLANLFEGLVTYDTANGSLIGGNAESWEISEDGLTYTFKLRDGLKWSDGSPLTADDYVYAFKRILKPETAAKYVNMVTDYIAGAEELYAGTGSEEALGVVAVDAQTLVLTLKVPTPYFINILTMWTFSPIQAATVEANGDRWTVNADTYICNGPFKIAEINMGESVVLVKNPEYYDADSVKLEKITFRYILDMATALMAFETGEIDGSRKIPASDHMRLKAEDAGVVEVPAYGTTFYNFNCAKAPFDNVLVRKAFSLAIDRNAIIEDVVQAPGEPAYSVVAPGYVVNGVDFTEGRSTFELSPTADVEAAQAALAEAGYPGGEGFPTVNLSYYSDDTAKKVAEAMAEMLMTNLNINIEITNADWAIYYEDVLAGNFEFCAMGWGADYLHPMTFLPLAKTGDVNNLGFYSNAEYDALVAQAQAETDEDTALAIMQQADAIASAEYAMLTLYHRTNVVLMKDKVTGYYLNPSDNLYLKTAEITE